MTDTTTPLVVQSYLAQLDIALIGVPDATAHDIRDAIAEELTGLGAPTAAHRIEQLGDPFFIAAQAREASREPALGEPSAGAPVASTTQQSVDSPARVDSPGYVVLAALLVALGGLVIPILGWIAGIVMVGGSKSWTRSEKLWTTLLPLGAMVVVAGVSTAVFLTAPTEAPPRYAEYSPAETTNPAIPFSNLAWYNIVASALLVLILVNFAVGLTLLSRARRRSRAEVERSSADNPVGNAAPLTPTRPPASGEASATDGVGYVLLASLLVALGGVVIPVLGWAAGLVMVCVSRAWTRFEKWAAVLTPLAAIVIVQTIVVLQRAAAEPAVTDGGGFQGPSTSDFPFPSPSDLLLALFVLVIVNFGVGTALLVRAFRRRESWRTRPADRIDANTVDRKRT